MSLIKKFIGKIQSLKKTLESKELEKFSVIKMEQVHDNKFAEITENKNQDIPGLDAIITTKKNILLSVKTADCLPILIHWTKNDDSSDIIAAIHSGRSGTKKKILTKVLLYLKSKYGVGTKVTGSTNNNESGKLTVWLGPAICKKCYQVDKKIDKHYDLYQENIDQVWKVFPKSEIPKNVLNNIKIIRSKHCTLHNNKLFYSYRKTGKGVKMNYSLIGLT